MNRVSCNRLHPVLFNEKVVICKKRKLLFLVERNREEYRMLLGVSFFQDFFNFY